MSQENVEVVTGIIASFNTPLSQGGRCSALAPNPDMASDAEPS